MLLARENVDSPLAAMESRQSISPDKRPGCQPLSFDNRTGGTLSSLKNAWDEKIIILRRVLHASVTAAMLFPTPISTLGGSHPYAHRAMETNAVDIASRTLSSLHYARTKLFRRHAALLVANSAVCLMSGFDFEV